MDEADAAATILATYPRDVQAIALRPRGVILAVILDAIEMPDPSSRIIAYGYGSGYKDIICSITPSKTGVKLKIVRGAVLPDPDNLLRGTGKLHRHIALLKPTDLEEPGIVRMLAAAVSAWKGSAVLNSSARSQPGSK